MCNGESKRVFCKHTAINVAEKIVLWLTFSNLHVVFQKIPHQAAKWNNLDFAIFIMAKYHSHSIKINVFILDIPDSCGSASAVQQKINDNPISVFGKGTVLFGPFKYYDYIK